MVDRYEALERYSRLRDEGVISEQEFAAEKAKLLGVQTAPPSQPGHDNLQPARVAESKPQSVAPLLWTVAAIVVVGLLGLFFTRQGDAPPSASAATTIAHRVPPCESTDARNLLTSSEAQSGKTIIAVYGGVERSFDAAAQIRTCAADVTFAAGGSAHVAFQMLPSSGAAPYMLELVGDPLATPSAEPISDAAAAGGNSDENMEAQADAIDAAHDRKQLEIAGRKPIVMPNEAGGAFCCVTLNDVARFFIKSGGSVTWSPSDDGSVTLSIKDPGGRWTGLTAFELNFDSADDDPTRVKIKSLTVDGNVQAVDVAGLIRDSLKPHPAAEEVSTRLQ